VLVSEVMLQQTQASRVGSVFLAFVRRFPTVESLASAPRADVVRVWDNLGYNRRAVSLHVAARTIVREHAGVLPSDVRSLRALRGIGPYTAAAVASIAFGMPVAAIDTNVRRVVSRLELGSDPVREADIASAADRWLDRGDPGAWNQAVMDLGRAVCRPVPRCDDCPLAGWCRFRRSGASASRQTRRVPAFDGSMRQVRGAVVRSLRERVSATVPDLAALTGHGEIRLREAADALVVDGIVERRRARYRLARA
jgi:A/G-specific adenine glycosylase